MNLAELVSKAKGLFRQPEKATQAVVQDRWDAAIYDEVVADFPRVAEMVGELRAHHDYAEDLVRDLALIFYQAAPEVRPAADMDPSRLLNHAVLTSVEQAPETVTTRQYTRHDTYGTGLGILSVAQQIKDLLDRPPQDEAQEAGEEASKAQEQAAGAGGALDGVAAEGAATLGAEEAAGQALETAMGGYQGEGPLTEGQQSAQGALEAAQAHSEAMAKALEAAIAAAEAAETAATEATTDAQHKADVARDNLDVLVRQGLKGATEALEAEQALLRAWGSDPGVLHNKTFAERQAMTRAMQNNRMSQYVDSMGRFHMTANATKAKKTEFGYDEFYSTEPSGDLDRILDGELAMLAIADGVDESLEMLQDQAMIDLVEDEMISRKYRGEEKVGKGALIVYVDTSKSMLRADAVGLPREVFAKAFAMALLECASHSKRDFVAILFANADNQKVYRFPKGEGTLQDRLDFCDGFFGGGTNFEVPLDMGMDILEAEFNAEGKAKGDMVFITDDDYRLTDAKWMERYQERKAKLAFRFFGVAVGMTTAGSALVALAKGGGNVRAVTDFMDPEVVLDIMQTT